jgi:predicted SnoaL-like aldol condensation-catalyzing enzyme
MRKAPRLRSGQAAIAAVLLAGLATMTVSAQYQVPQQTTYAMTAAERVNLQLVHDFWRDIMLGANRDIASHYLPANFISRNPNVAEGRDAFVQALKTRPELIQNAKNAGVPEVQFAEGDYVFLMWANFIINPIEPAKIFKYNTLDLFRIQDGKIVEHWDGARKTVETDFGAKSRGGGTYVHSTSLTAREQETLRLGRVEFKDILQYGHTDLAMKFMAPGYMQHNVNVPGGRDNFIKNFSTRPRMPLAEAWITPPTLELVSGNFYLKFDERMEGPQGGRQSAYYRFDMVRVDDGLIWEHWDVAFPNGVQR